MSQLPFETVSVIGLGYIGLPTAAMLAAHGVNVIGVDIDPRVVATVRSGRIHIVEPGLDAMVRDAVAARRLTATNRPQHADAFVIAVPTPFGRDHQPDLRFVEAAVASISPVLEKGNLVVIESTCPVGTTERVVEWLASRRPDLRMPGSSGGDPDVHVAYCPERVLPGRVVRELALNDRVIGGFTAQCCVRATQLYRLFVEGDLHVTTTRTAEMCKLTENAFRDVNVAFANELSLICHRLGIDVRRLIELANFHPRVNVLQPGAGVGGHCIAVDPWFIVDSAPDEARLIRAAREVNDSKPQWVLARIHEAMQEQLGEGAVLAEEGLTVAVLGLAFKPDIDDLRQSPALEIARRLVEGTKATVLVVEPNIHELPEALSRCTLVSLDEALVRSDVIAVLVGHSEFAGLAARLGEQSLVDAVGVSKVPQRIVEQDEEASHISP